MQAMRFGGVLQCILKQILTTDPQLGPLYLSKVDLAEACIRLWVRMEDILSVAFLIPEKTPSDTLLVGFHLSPPRGTFTVPPIFVWLRRQWPTLQTTPSPRGSRQVSTRWI